MFSNIALKIYTLKKEGIIKTNSQFWKNFYNKAYLNSIEIDTKNSEIELNYVGYNLICSFDSNFPNLEKIKISERPFLFAYKGDIGLLNQTDNNVAVVGVTSPTKDIVEREEKIVKELSEKNINIISGLARGCDTVAHKTCIKNGGKTIAILPTDLNNVYPKENKKLVDEIIKTGGLVITEYVTKPQHRYETIKRFIDRDRLQAMFSNAVILIASYVKGQGDSGSGYAMQKAKEYCKTRYVMFNEKTDKGQEIFRLNEELLNDKVQIITKKSIKEIIP